jgi:NTE family protein
MSEEQKATGESAHKKTDKRADAARPLEAGTHQLNASTSDLSPEAGAESADQAKARKGFWLCLSGGGYRAALFHLGALRRLNELGVLSQITNISSVSGGSIIAAHLAATVKPWPKFGEAFQAWDEKVAQPFLDFTAVDIRTLPNLKMLLPWNFFRKGYNTKQLADQYLRLTNLKLAELPAKPTFTFCATDMVFGVNWEFKRDETGDFQVGYVPTPGDWPLAFAVAASSCFPPLFRPLPVNFAAEQFKRGKARHRKDFKELAESIRLTDGGNYDNLGLEPAWKKKAQYVLVSDGGGVFRYEPRSDWFWQLFRYIGISSLQAIALRRRWHLANISKQEKGYKGTYMGINSVYKHDPSLPVYSENLVEEVIAAIRTDMDAFSKAERAVLENHGYLIAESQIQRKLPELALIPAALKVPHPEWMPRPAAGNSGAHEKHVRDALADSHKRKLGRLKS